MAISTDIANTIVSPKAYADWDLSHGCKNAMKAIAKGAKLWSHLVLVATAGNVAYGSTLSPARHTQLREAMHEYWSHNDETELIFQHFL